MAWGSESDVVRGVTFPGSVVRCVVFPGRGQWRGMGGTARDGAGVPGGDGVRGGVRGGGVVSLLDVLRGDEGGDGIEVATDAVCDPGGLGGAGRRGGDAGGVMGTAWENGGGVRRGDPEPEAAAPVVCRRSAVAAGAAGRWR